MVILKTITVFAGYKNSNTVCEIPQGNAIRSVTESEKLVTTRVEDLGKHF